MTDIGAAFAEFRTQFEDGPAPPPQAANSLQPMNSQRMHLAGGEIASLVMPRAYQAFESVFRKIPPSGIYSASARAPVRFEMGAYRVPTNMALIVIDQRFDVYRPSGAFSGDFEPLDERRLPLSTGWNMRVDQGTVGTVSYELQPSAAVGAGTMYQSAPNPGFIPGGNGQFASNEEFARARSAEQLNPSGAGSQTMPQRHDRGTLAKLPLTFIVPPSSRLVFECVIFNAVPVPIAFFEVEVVGALTSYEQVQELLRANPQPGLVR